MSAQRAHQIGLGLRGRVRRKSCSTGHVGGERDRVGAAGRDPGHDACDLGRADIGRRNALTQASNIVMLGTVADNLAEGQEAFKSGKREWRLR